MSRFPVEAVICLGSVGAMLLLLSFVVVMRYISYRETLALAEKGLLPPRRNAGQNRGALIWGISLSAVGLALCLGLWPLGALGPSYPLGLGPWMLAGLLPLFFGLGLILIYVLLRKGRQPDEPAAPLRTPPVDE